ncbi:DUF3592 domain-containing protein [Mesorhizobium sp. CAU 1741]|uniref:DUF3592 domain-containing protein n=1 Tax=Mesorhizobium sp. CAU 1741 TaxID=3140366 RepID=UPI00325A92E6
MTNLTQSDGLRWLTAGCSLILVCAVMLPVALMDLGHARLPEDWPATAGIVEQSGIGSTSTGSGRLGVDWSYFPSIHYRYSVGGQTYLGNVVYRGKGPAGEAAVRALVERYPAGASVNVFYDPRDPTQAVLLPEVQLKNYHAILAMTLGLVAGISCLLRFRAIRRREI